MSLISFQQAELEKKMKAMFDEIDDLMEDRYHLSWHLHPNRLERGKSANKESDGLFNIGAAFSAGFGSEHGRGYVVDVSLSTLERVPFDVKKKIYQEVALLIEERLSRFFPERELQVVRDHTGYKIIGDFSLGSTAPL